MQMNIVRSVRAAGILTVAAAIIATLPSDALASREDSVYAALADAGISRDQVSEIDIYSQEGSDGRTRGSQAWARVDQCPQGWVVVTMGRSGNVTQVYTRDGCEIPGI